MSVPLPAPPVAVAMTGSPVARHHVRGPDPASPYGQGRVDRPVSGQWARPMSAPGYREPPPAAAEPLADGLFLALHDDTTGAPRLRPLRMGLGLAAALLAELVYARKIAISGTTLSVIDHTPPLDALDHLVVEQLRCEANCRELAMWLGYLRVKARDLVGERLLRKGAVELGHGKRGMTLYVPAGAPLAAAWPGVRVSEQLRRLGPLEQQDIVLAGLMAATGLHRQVLAGADRAVFDYLSELINGLPRPLYDLVVATRVEVDKTISTART